MSSSAPAPGTEGPVPGDLQFERAEPLPPPDAPGSGPECAACKQPIVNTYYHAQGMVVCETCAQRIQSGQQAPPPLSMARAIVYGCGAALAGSILYATVSIITGFEIGLIAIVVGVMVGKAIRHGSLGLGGRPQQILAVLLTYFAITTSYIPVFIYQQIKEPAKVAQTQSAAGKEQPKTEIRPPMSFSSVLVVLVLLTAVAPFLSLGSGVGGIIGLFIIFIGLQRAWSLTGRTEILVMGPYAADSAQ